ncbi:unnamed protein product [Peronospora destructor]|uniref:B-block binding subunit of TFIIIC domain-containing protein n=1 Tax=Peronospora destructor TaxID=86335 RepID=A0AAV0T195_9STRA|nr:unnamed protein product [Peronospora destructor]
MLSRRQAPRELVAVCMDYIALEGSTGVSVLHLFSSIDPSNDVLGLLVRNDHVFMKEHMVKVKREMTDTTGHFNSNEKMTITTEEVMLITYDAVMAETKHKLLMVVACEELRHRALNMPVKAIAADLGETHFCILEAVGHARVQGVTVTTLVKLLRGGTVKRLHNCLDTLISYGLVVKRMMIVARPVMRRLNIIHLPRFAAEFKPQMFDKSADFESDEQSKKILCAAAETYLRGLPTRSSVLSDLGRDLSLHKRHLEMLRSHIMQECKVDENFPLELFQAVLQPSRRASHEPKILNCVRYKPPNTQRNFTCRRGIVLELGLLRQIYGIIEDSAENGTTIIDLRNQIVLPGSKLPYKLLGVLAGMYSLKAESIILGKNKAFRLYLDSMAPGTNNKSLSSADVTDSTLSLLTHSNEHRRVDEEPITGVNVERAYTVRTNKALKVALEGAEVDGTSDRRRKHILERLGNEKIISLSSLCASVFSMEKQRAETNVLLNSISLSGEPTVPNKGSSLISPAAVGKVDTRSIFRIATELEIEKKLRLLQLPLPARNVSTKFRALRCVVAPGYEHNDMFLQDFVKNYCRDERLRRIHRNADKGGVAGNKDASFQTNSHAFGVETEVSNSASPEISYRIRRFVSQQKSGVHNQQFRKLGFAYGVMYRCKALHRFLWKALHEKGSSLQLPGEENHATVQDSITEGDGSYSTGSQKQHQPTLPGIVFSRESVLHSMPVHLYIQIFSGGTILTGAEFAIVEETIKHQRTFQAIPEGLRQKMWSHESQRTAKVLGTLADLGLVLPHKIGMKHLVKILRAGYTDGRDGVLSRALNENALGGLFRFNKQVRIVLDDSDREARFFSPGDSERRSVNEFDAIRVVGFTEKTYSFADSLPLRFSFQSECDVDRYWEALECLCLEQMTMEVGNARKNEPVVCGVPKPVKTRARRMLRILAWIPKSRKPAPKHKLEDGSDTAHFTISGIVSTNVRSRKKRRLAQHGDETKSWP